MAQNTKRLEPYTSERTLKQILEIYAKTNGENSDRILDPEHPLMIKFQNDLKNHLLKLHEETDEQMRQMRRAVKDQRKENDTTGKKMCTIQKELKELKQNAIDFDEEKKKIAIKEEKSFKKLKEMEKSHKNLNELLLAERDKDLKLQEELENLSLQVVQLANLQIESFSDSSTVKGALKKTKKDRHTLEVEKLRQDMLIARLEADQNSMQDKINLYKSQWAIKKQQLEETQKILKDAESDIEAINFEKLQLMQQWKNSISSLEKRDEASATIRQLVSQKEDELIRLSVVIASLKKQIRKELVENEKLTSGFLIRDSTVMHIKKQMKKSLTRQKALEEELVFFGKAVTKEEQNLAELTHLKDQKKKDVEAKEREVEKSNQLSRKLDNEKIKILGEKLVKDKATEVTEKELKILRKSIEDMEGNCILKEGEESKCRLKLAESKHHIAAMEDYMTMLKKEIAEKEMIVAKNEAEIAEGNHLIEKKQIYIMELNNKLSELVAETGGTEVGPLQREISNIKKEIAHSDDCRRFQEQEWLRYQRQLVSLTNEASGHFAEIDMLHRKEAVLEENKIRLTADLAQEENEIKELHRNIHRTRNDIARLTSVLHREKSSQERLEMENEMMKGDFLGNLKEAELEFIKKDNEMVNLKKKHSQLLNKLKQTQHEIVTWEEKLQMAEEIKKVMRSESHAKEIAVLNSEIHRLQLHWEQIKKQESKLIQEMERAAFQHAQLYVKADFQSLYESKKKSNYYFSKKLERLKKKRQDDKKKIEGIRNNISCKNLLLYEMKQQEEEQTDAIAQATEEIGYIDSELRGKERQKWQDIINLSYKQKKYKLLEQIQNKEYIWASRRPDQRAQLIDKIQNNFSIFKEMIENLINSHPELKEKFLKIIDHIIVSSQI